MIETLASIAAVVDSTVALVGGTVRGLKKHNDARKRRAIRAAVDPNAISEAVSIPSLVPYMRGGITASSLKGIQADLAFQNLEREFIACILGQGPSNLRSIAAKGVERRIIEILSEHNTPADSKAFADAYTSQLTEVAEFSLSALIEMEPALAEAVAHSNQLSNIATLIDNIVKHSEAAARLDDISCRQQLKEFEKTYRRVCAERHGYIRPPDFEHNYRFVADELYVPPHIFPVGEYPLTMSRLRSTTVDEFIAKITRNVVLGDPGGGKSTLSNFVATTLANDENGPLPFHLTLRELPAAIKLGSIVEELKSNLSRNYQIDVQASILEDYLATGRAIVIFDGLDELIDTSDRREMTRTVETFAVRYPLARILVTSRKVGYDQARLDPRYFSEHEIDGFQSSQVEKYVRNWFTQAGGSSGAQLEATVNDFMFQSASVPDLRSNPLLLALICIIYKGEHYIPRNRPEVYERCSRLLFEKWDRHRKIEVPLRAADHIDDGMKFLAYKSLSQASYEDGLPEPTLVDWMTSFLLDRAFETRASAIRAAEEFVEFCRDRAWVFSEAGTTGAGERLYKFTHRTFLEYFAAAHLTLSHDTPEQVARELLPRVARSEWDVVAQLAVQQANKRVTQGTNRALSTLIEDKTGSSDIRWG